METYPPPTGISGNFRASQKRQALPDCRGGNDIGIRYVHCDSIYCIPMADTRVSQLFVFVPRRYGFMPCSIFPLSLIMTGEFDSGVIYDGFPSALIVARPLLPGTSFGRSTGHGRHQRLVARFRSVVRYLIIRWARLVQDLSSTVDNLDSGSENGRDTQEDCGSEILVVSAY